MLKVAQRGTQRMQLASVMFCPAASQQSSHSLYPPMSFQCYKNANISRMINCIPLSALIGRLNYDE